MERAGWSSGLFRAVKLVQSFSTSGPSATSKPMERKISSTRSQVRITGWMPPGARPRPGRVTSMVSEARRASSSACANAARPRFRNSSTFFLAWLICAPISRFCSGSSLPSPLSSTVSAPSLPRKRAFSFSSAAASWPRRTFLRLGDQVVNRLSHESSPQNANGAMTAPFAAMRDELKRAIRQPTQPWLAARWRQSRPCRARPDRPGPCGQARSQPSSGRR